MDNILFNIFVVATGLAYVAAFAQAYHEHRQSNKNNLGADAPSGAKGWVSSHSIHAGRSVPARQFRK